MKKILIISYFFPPCTLTAAQRPLFWVKYLKDFGYYPIVITRRWDKAIRNPSDVLESTGQEVLHEKKDGYEVYALPYQAALRDKIFTKFNGTLLSFLSKPFTLLYLILQNFSVGFIPYKNLYVFAKKLLKEQADITKLVITGNPFEQFFFGYLLNKTTGITWLADYRDDWTTTELTSPNSWIEKFLFRLEERSEKKWVGTAAKISSVSPHYTNKIANLVNRPGEVLLNGYDQSQPAPAETDLFSVYTIVYNGTLYASQKIEVFLTAVKQVIDQLGVGKVHVYFPGLAFDQVQAERVKNHIVGYEQHFTITPRIPKAEVIRIQSQAQLMLMVPHEGIKGIPSSKLFEYLGLAKTTLLVPNDQDIIEEILEDCGLGHICNTVAETTALLIKLINSYERGEAVVRVPTAKLSTYSRYEQTKKLAHILDSI